MEERFRPNPSENPLIREALSNKKKKAENNEKETRALFDNYKSLILNYGKEENTIVCSIKFPEGESVDTIVRYNPQLKVIELRIQFLDDYLSIPEFKGNATLQSRKNYPNTQQPLKTEILNKKEFSKYIDLANIIGEQLRKQKSVSQPTK